MTILQKAYNELLVLSNKRVSDLHTLHDFITAAHSELTWLKEKEDKEVNRNWAEARNMKLLEVEKYYEELMSQLDLNSLISGRCLDYSAKGPFQGKL